MKDQILAIIKRKYETGQIGFMMALEEAYNSAIESNAIKLIISERKRQIDIYGYSDEYIANTTDDYGNGELANAAGTYALDEMSRDYGPHGCPTTYPWPEEYWKPSISDRVKELIKAGAMIVAEIDRLTKSTDDQTKPNT